MTAESLSTMPPVSRVVVRAPNWLGDAVLALPAMAAVRAAFAHAHVTIAAPAGLAGLYREDTNARPDQVLDLPDANRATIAALASAKFDLAVLFPNSFRAAWQCRRAGIRERWGYATAGRGWMLTRASRHERSAAPRHHAEYFRALVQGLGMVCGDDLPRVQPSAENLERAAALLVPRAAQSGAPIVGFAPGAAYGQAKQWPPDRVAALIARLVADRGATCVVVGAGHDRDASRAIESWLRAHAASALGHVVDLVGRTNLGVLAAVTGRCDVFVSNDSGAMHVAAATGRPVAAMFGPTDEHATRPLGMSAVLTARAFCRPCHLRDCPIDHRCMKRISVDRAYDAVTALLPARRAG